MKLLELIKQTDFDKISKYYLKYFDPVDDLFIKKEDIPKLMEHFKVYYDVLSKVKDNKKPATNVLVVSKVNYSAGNDFEYIVYSVKKNELIKKAKLGNITLWDGPCETRVEHYGVDFTPSKRLMNFEVAPATLKLDPNLVFACIFDENTIFGFSDDEKDERSKKLYEDLKESLDQALEHPESLKSHEEVMDELCEKYGLEREEKDLEKEKELDKLREKNMKKSHKQVIKDVMSILE